MLVQKTMVSPVLTQEVINERMRSTVHFDVVSEQQSSSIQMWSTYHPHDSLVLKPSNFRSIQSFK